MEKTQIKILKILLPTIFTICLVSLLWPNIKLPYSNPHEIIGVLSIFKQHSFNDTLRYIIFVSLPLIMYFVIYINLNKSNCSKLINITKFSNDNNRNIYLPLSYLFITIAFIFVRYLSSDFNINKMDLFHEGQHLGGATSYELTNNLWSSTFSVTSLFTDFLNAKIAWYIHGVKSIAAYRHYTQLITELTYVFYLIFFFILSSYINIEKKLKITLYLTLSTYLIFFTSYNTVIPRDIPVIIFLILSLKLIYSNKNYYLSSSVMGILPLLSFLWSLDRGVFLMPSLFFLIIIFLINKEYLKVKIIFTNLIISFFVFYILVGQFEFYNFLENSFSILRDADLVNGLMHPSPFSDDPHSVRGTKSLILILINGIFVISLLLNKKFRLSNNEKIYLIVFYILSVAYYKIGLTRSDGGHIKQGMFLSILLFTITLFFFISRKLNKLKTLKNFLPYLNVLLIILPIFFYIVSDSLKKIENINNFHIRYQDYLKLDDEFFLKDNEIKIKTKLLNLTKNEKCFQTFTYESAFTYFLKKKSCSKFYHIFNLGTKKNQLIFINELKENKPKFILTGGTYKNIGMMKGKENQTSKLSPEKRFPYISNYILENYKVFETINEWDIMIIN